MVHYYLTAIKKGGVIKMATENKNGISTRKKILSTCRHLFYEEGFSAVTFAGICKATNTNPGSVSYHFKSKINIALLIYQEIMETLSNESKALFPDSDLTQQRMLALAMHLRLLYDNAKYRRFSAEVCTQRAYDKELSRFVYSYSEPFLVAKEYMSEQKALFYFAAMIGMDGYLESYIDRDIDHLTFDEIFNYYIELHYSFLEKMDFSKRISRVYEDLGTLDIRISEDFKLSIAPCPQE
jgi:AcrR family transcriptional regulator